MKQDFNERLNYFTVHRIMRKEQTNETLEFVWNESMRVQKRNRKRVEMRKKNSAEIEDQISMSIDKNDAKMSNHEPFQMHQSK